MAVRAQHPFRYDNQLGNRHGRWYVRGNPTPGGLYPTNREAAKQPEFVAACGRAGVSPTRRQASKYMRGFGAAKRGGRKAVAA